MAALVTAWPTCWLICCLVLAGIICAIPAPAPPGRDGISGAGRAWPPGRPPGNGGAAPPPGRFGIAGAGLALAGAGGGPRPAGAPMEPSDPCCCGAALRGPPGLGGDSRGLSRPLDSQSFFTGGGTGVVKVAIDTSPMMRSASLQA
uniref:Putative collagen triple helix repeat protein n=1 Tax=Anopheles braziliensis TaxID=58242 RepID=A0A2M3ZMA7_9DIPT